MQLQRPETIVGNPETVENEANHGVHVGKRADAMKFGKPGVQSLHLSRNLTRMGST